MRNESKADFLAGNRTQTGQMPRSGKPGNGGDRKRDMRLILGRSPSCPMPFQCSPDQRMRLTTVSAAFPLALNFIASGE